MAARLSGAIAEYFAAVDAQIDRLVRRFDDRTVFVVSDHGFGPMHRAIDLNTWLLAEGYIGLKRSRRSRLKARLWRMGVTNERVARAVVGTVFRYGAGLAGKIPDETMFKVIEFFAHRAQRNPLLSMDDVDWSGTRAYAQVGMGAINVNVQGREPAGSVRPGTEYQALKEEIVDKLRNLRDPETGARIGGRVLMREEVYRGPYLDRAPDIVFIPSDSGYVAGSLMGFAANRPIVDAPGWTGHHRMNGIFLGKGPGLRRGARVEGARLIDVAPTVLHLLGSRVPPEMDGRVLTDIFEDGFLTRRAIEYREPRELAVNGQGTAPTEEVQVVKRLRDLGYLV
jgi:predicted AlkP superfamily phosphohydrolase/phosphomutase